MKTTDTPDGWEMGHLFSRTRHTPTTTPEESTRLVSPVRVVPKRTYKLDGSSGQPPAGDVSVEAPQHDEKVFAAARRVADGTDTAQTEARQLIAVVGVVEPGFWSETVRRGLRLGLPADVLGCVKPIMDQFNVLVQEQRVNPAASAATQALMQEEVRKHMAAVWAADRGLTSTTVVL